MLGAGKLVSIPSRLGEAGERRCGRLPGPGAGFQSAPALVRRENLIGDELGQWKLEFQSAPALVRRENVAGQTATLQVPVFQSAPALVRRENDKSKDSVYQLPRFQSAPALVRRENIFLGKFAIEGVQVSIRSRLGEAGEPECLWTIRTRLTRFQSAPALVRRENQWRRIRLDLTSGFNPLPPW